MTTTTAEPTTDEKHDWTERDNFETYAQALEYAKYLATKFTSRYRIVRRSESVMTGIRGRVVEDATETLTVRFVVEYADA